MTNREDPDLNLYCLFRTFRQATIVLNFWTFTMKQMQKQSDVDLSLLCVLLNPLLHRLFLDQDIIFYFYALKKMKKNLS